MNRILGKPMKQGLPAHSMCTEALAGYTGSCRQRGKPAQISGLFKNAWI